MRDDRPPEERRPQVRHTDLSKLEGAPSPEADHAYFSQRSDLGAERTRDGFKIRGIFTGHALSPINVSLAQAINTATASGVWFLAHHFHASPGWAFGVGAAAWMVGTGLNIGAMRTFPRRNRKT